MASSDVTADLSSLEADRDESPDGRNIDEVVGATVEEATNTDGAPEQPKDHLHDRGPENLSIDLYDTLQILVIDGH